MVDLESTLESRMVQVVDLDIFLCESRIDKLVDLEIFLLNSRMDKW